MEIIRAGMQEADRAAALAQLLWPGHAQAELEQELAGYLQGPEGAVRRGPGKKAVPNLQATVGWTTPQAPCFICAQALPRRGASSASQSGCEERGE